MDLGALDELVRAGWPTFPDDDLYGALERATAALVRLDTMLAAAPPALAHGWLARMALDETAASCRLTGVLVDGDELRLLVFDALDRAPDPDLAQALPLYELIRRAWRRHPRHLYTPLRLSALMRVRAAAPVDSFQADTGDERGDAGTALAAALDPAALKGLETFPALVGAALFLSHWQACGAERALGAAAGRILAAWWPARRGLVRPGANTVGDMAGIEPLPPSAAPHLKGTDTIAPTPFAGGPVLMPSLGFLGHAMSYRPDRGSRWVADFLAAAERGLARGEARRQHLVRAQTDLAQALRPRRSTSRGPLVASYLLAHPVVTSARLGRDLAMSDTAARQLLDALARDHLVAEISGRESFRAYALA